MSQVRIRQILGDNFQRFFTRIFGSHVRKASVVEHQLIPLIDPRLTCQSLLDWNLNQYLIKILIDNRLTSQLLLSQYLLNISVNSQSRVAIKCQSIHESVDTQPTNDWLSIKCQSKNCSSVIQVSIEMSIKSWSSVNKGWLTVSINTQKQMPLVHMMRIFEDFGLDPW